MVTTFLHGIEVLDIDDGYRPIQTVASSVIGIVGTAPDADAALFPLNTPTLLTRPLDIAQLGLTGTLPAAIDLIWQQAGAVIVMIRVAADGDPIVELNNVVGSAALNTGVHALTLAHSALNLSPRVLLAPGFTHQRSTGGVATITPNLAGSGYVTAPTVTISTPPGGGRLATATATLGTGVNSDKVVGIAVNQPGQGYVSVPSVTLSAPPSGVTATATATIGSVRNQVVSEFEGVANKLRAVIIADGPNTTDADAVQLDADFGSDRIYAIDPWVVRGGVTMPASPVVAGIINRVDNERGFWWSPSNNEIFGIEAVSRYIDFTMGDTTSRANLLNASNIATIIRLEGFRLWGNRSLAMDPRYQFLAVRRTADMIADSVQRASFGH